MKFALVLAFCVALASARFPEFEEERRRADDWQSGGSKDTSCQVGSRKVKTFDNTKLTVSLPDCYTVLAKDCSSSEPKFVVLMRKLSQNSDLKEIKIVTPNKKVVVTASEYSNRVKITVDNQQVPLEKDQDLTLRGYPTIRISKEGQQQVKIDILDQDLQIRFDGYVCDIKSSEQSQNKKCGLCGLSNSEVQSADPADGRRLLQKFVTKDCRQSESESEFNEYVPINQRQCKRCSARRQADDQFLRDEDELNEQRKRSDWRNSESESEFNEYVSPMNQRQYKRSSARRQSDDQFLRDEDEQLNEQRKRRSPNRIFDDIFEHQSPDWDSDFKEINERSPRYFSDEIYGQSDKRGSDKFFDDEDSDDFFGGKYDSAERPVLKHKIVKRGDEICVSLVRIPQCSDNSYPEGKVQKRVPYHCIYSNDPRVWKYESKIRNGEQIPEIQRATTSMTRTEVIPTKCNKNVYY